MNPSEAILVALGGVVFGGIGGAIVGTLISLIRAAFVRSFDDMPEIVRGSVVGSAAAGMVLFLALFIINY